MTELGVVRGKPANSFVPAGNLVGDEYSFRINPALLSKEGNPEIIVVDATYLGMPSEQWIAKAEWIDGKPKLVGLDYTAVSQEGEGFSLLSAAMFGQKIVKSFQRVIAMESKKIKPFLEAPDDYSTGIN